MGLPTWAACLRSETALHGVASVLPCATVSRTCHGGRMAPSLLVCYTLAKTVVLFTGRVQDAVHARTLLCHSCWTPDTARSCRGGSNSPLQHVAGQLRLLALGHF